MSERPSPDFPLADRVLRGVCFDCHDLSGEEASKVDLRGASLVNAVLQEANFEGANITGARFLGADIREAYWGDRQPPSTD